MFCFYIYTLMISIKNVAKKWGISAVWLPHELKLAYSDFLEKSG